VKLQYPISWGENELVSEVVFTRRIQAKDLKGVPINGVMGMEHILLLIARLTGKTQTQLEQLDMVDLTSLSNVVSNFLGNGPLTSVI
jgi:hypothetical protein